MPAALERALKRRATKLGLGKKRRDAYVYGTLRKTGWVPSHQKMESINSRLVRLAAIDDQLNDLVNFQYDEDPAEQERRRRAGLLGAGALVGTGVGGTLLHQAVGRSGGYGANLGAARTAAKYGPDLLAKATGQAVSPGRMAGSAFWRLKNLAKPILGKFGLDSKEKPITLDDTLLEPFQGSAFKSKIETLQFPAGLSPAAALKLPFPQLMALLQKKQILRQVFSKKQEKLIELNAKLDEIQFQPPEDEVEDDRRQWRKDRSGKTIKGGLITTAGLAGGYAAGKGIQATHPILRYRAGKAAALKAGGRGGALTRKITSGVKAARYARFSTELDNIIEFKLPENLKAKFKDKEKVEIKKKKGRVSHGGGT